jgi:signal transduction histidine kinase/Tfp pilus assembly protein PilF
VRFPHLFTFLLFLSAFSASAENVDSLLQVLAINQNKLSQPEKYIIHYNLALAYGPMGKETYDLSLQHSLIAFNIAKELNDFSKMADSKYAMGESQERKNNYKEAIESYKEVVEMGDTKFINTHLLDAHTQLANIYQAIGDYENAYENLMQALSISDTKNDTSGKAKVHYNIGSLFFYQKQYEKALEHYEKSKAINDETPGKNKRADYACMAALGSVHEKLKNYSKSLEYNLISLRLAEELNYKTGIAYALGNIAVNYKMQGRLAEAEKMMLKAVGLKKELGNNWGTIGSQIDLSNLYLTWNKPQKALHTLFEALDLSNNHDSKGRQPDIYLGLTNSYDKLNDPVNSLLYLKKYISLKDSLISEKTLEEMGQSKRRYEVREQEHQIAIVKKENQILIQKDEIRKQQSYLFGTAFVAFLMFLWWYKSKLNYQHKVNKLLGEKNSLLADKNEEIHIKNKQLENSNEDLQQFAYVASHDLKEPLRMINSYTTLLNRRYNEVFDDSGKEFMHYVIDAVKRMETLLDDLLDFSRAGTQPPPTKYIDLKDVMVIVEANLRHRLQTLNAELVINDRHLPKVKAHRTLLIQLLQNLVSNGVKFKGNRDPKVIIDCCFKDNQYVLSVTDNGIGISKENLEKVFEMFRRLHTREEYEGTGIGLATCKRIVSSWGGDIWVESTVGEGSTFFFSFPNSIVEAEAVAV